MPSPKILAFSGSTRRDSYNQSLVSLAAESARVAGAEVTIVNLRDFSMPLFDQDDEAANGLPDAAKQFKALLRDHDGWLISSPEYNSSVTGVLKNSLDWASRAETESEAPLVAFRGKVAGLLSASPGALGGLRGLVHLRAILGNVGVVVLPDQVTLSGAGNAFLEGKLQDERKAQQVKKLGETLTQFVRRHLAS